MPITITFDIEAASVRDANDRARMFQAFERLGWENIGGSCWRYPRLSNAQQHASEDWFNHVIPALMYFRAIVEHSGMNVTQFTIDAHSEAGYRFGPPTIGQPISGAQNITMYQSTFADDKLSERRLRQFISDAANSLK